MPPPQMGPEEFAQRVLAAVREDVLGGAYKVDPRTGDVQSVPLHRGITYEDVRLDKAGEVPIIAVLFRSVDHPDCLFGYPAEIPYDPSAETHDPEEEAMYLLLPLDEQLDYKFLPDECHPDENGITWV